MEIDNLVELRRLMYDSNTPLSLRQQAMKKYEKGLDEAAREFDGFVEQIKETSNESGNTL